MSKIEAKTEERVTPEIKRAKVEEELALKRSGDAGKEIAAIKEQIGKLKEDIKNLTKERDELKKELETASKASAKPATPNTSAKK